MNRRPPAAGRGRKRGSKNKRTIHFRRLLEQKLGDAELLDLLLTIAKGTKREVLNGRGAVVTIQDPPDGATARYLADRKWGKVPQPLAGVPDSPVRVILDAGAGLGLKP